MRLGFQCNLRLRKVQLKCNALLFLGRTIVNFNCLNNRDIECNSILPPKQNFKVHQCVHSLNHGVEEEEFRALQRGIFSLLSWTTIYLCTSNHLTFVLYSKRNEYREMWEKISLQNFLESYKKFVTLNNHFTNRIMLSKVFVKLNMNKCTL